MKNPRLTILLILLVVSACGATGSQLLKPDDLDTYVEVALPLRNRFPNLHNPPTLIVPPPKRPTTGTDYGHGTLPWPTDWRYMTDKYWQLDPRRRNEDKMEGHRKHDGIDIAGKVGDPVYAIDAGIVVYVGERRGFGNMIDVAYPNGIIARYAHLSKVEVRENESVTNDHVLGYIGVTGRTRGPHLHFEILKRGTSKNPLAYIR